MAVIRGGKTVKNVTSFPENASIGDLVYHTILKALFINVNENGDTTDILKWEISSNKTIIASVNPSSQQIVDSVDGSLYRTVKWILSITNITDSIFTSSEVLAVHDDTNVTHNEYSMVGDKVNYLIDVELNGNDINLKISNIENNEIQISVLRWALL